MLTAEIKQKIDNARNILVGKIPTPTGQVEQITLALVYKFMNDIDEQNKELGGELKFFTGAYSKYAWKHLLDKSLSAYERVTAYGEGLEKMHLNPNLPQFFRNVFKGAFLPFRDPEVLTIFLKQIDEFKYGHNGDLGDAFEYLLQVMGTQGDAGQFLTPRHIINFIVNIVDPLKTDKTLDPAEGTAGFLISTFLHILKNNTKPGSNLPGSALTYNERKKLSENLVGYDISHDMVRLSLVNLYLHGFADPKIYEYDTLGNLDRWDDDFDCILTNPPFMTPKGGVKPHKRFSIQAKKSEVLFVDYIMEHLNPNGKSGIIVPEGIIFQSATAYKALRKMMIDQNFLYAVVSLPGGIFNPYSGVKTSVLFMDRVLAKKTKDILFIKIENDGFDLGAQRRPIDENDLPEATEILKRYKLSLQSGKKFELSDEEKKMANLVPIEKISKSGDYNLSGDRYKKMVSFINQKWPMVELSEIFFEIKNGRNVEQIDDKGKYKVSRIQTISNWTVDLSKTKWTKDDVPDEDFLKDGDILLSHINSMDHLAKSALVSNINEKVVHGINLLRLRPNKEILNPYYASFVFQNDHFINKARTFAQKAVNQASIKSSDIKLLTIPLPPLEIQQEIVSQLDSYQKIIDGAQQVVDNYKPEIKIDPEWEWIELGKICNIYNGSTPSRSNSEYWNDGSIPWFTVDDIREQGRMIKYTKQHITDKALQETSLKLLPKDTVLICCTASVGEYGISRIPLTTNQQFNGMVIKDNSTILPDYLLWAVSDLKQALSGLGGTTAFKFVSVGDLKTVKIPLPSLDIQKQIISRIEEEQKIVDANKKLIELYQGKIKEKIDEVWGK